MARQPATSERESAAASVSPLLDVRDVTMRYSQGRHQTLTALDGLTLHVERGEFVALVGPSGCGKSTLLRAIVGVQIVQAGRISVLGLEAGSPALRRTTWSACWQRWG